MSVSVLPPAPPPQQPTDSASASNSTPAGITPGTPDPISASTTSAEVSPTAAPIDLGFDISEKTPAVCLKNALESQGFSMRDIKAGYPKALSPRGTSIEVETFQRTVTNSDGTQHLETCAKLPIVYEVEVERLNPTNGKKETATILVKQNWFTTVKLPEQWGGREEEMFHAKIEATFNQISIELKAIGFAARGQSEVQLPIYYSPKKLIIGYLDSNPTHLLGRKITSLPAKPLSSSVNTELEVITPGRLKVKGKSYTGWGKDPLTESSIYRLQKLTSTIVMGTGNDQLVDLERRRSLLRDIKTGTLASLDEIPDPVDRKFVTNALRLQVEEYSDDLRGLSADSAQSLTYYHTDITQKGVTERRRALATASDPSKVFESIQLMRDRAEETIPQLRQTQQALAKNAELLNDPDLLEQAKTMGTWIDGLETHVKSLFPPVPTSPTPPPPKKPTGGPPPAGTPPGGPQPPPTAGTPPGGPQPTPPPETPPGGPRPTPPAEPPPGGPPLPPPSSSRPTTGPGGPSPIPSAYPLPPPSLKASEAPSSIQPSMASQQTASTPQAPSGPSGFKDRPVAMDEPHVRIDAAAQKRLSTLQPFEAASVSLPQRFIPGFKAEDLKATEGTSSATTTDELSESQLEELWGRDRIAELAAAEAAKAKRDEEIPSSS